MIIVSDTSPITNLIQINHLDLLEKIFGEVIITPSVEAELFQIEKQKEIINNVSWIKTETPSDNAFVQKLLVDLDQGEAESIALAIEIHADLLLIDEQKGRKIAISSGLKITGLIGVVVKAKEMGLIGSVRSILDDLTTRAGFRIHPDLYGKILQSVNE